MDCQQLRHGSRDLKTLSQIFNAQTAALNTLNFRNYMGDLQTHAAFCSTLLSPNFGAYH